VHLRWFAAALILSLWAPASLGAVESAAPVAAIGDAAYLEELLAQAGARRLWEERMWRLLLHYRENSVFGGVTSEADGPGFFTAPDGKTNPQSELEATLAAFFSTRILEPGKQTAQCTFVARFHWLNARLGFDPQRLPHLPCERFAAWRASLDPDSVMLVFASHFFNSPASMFGHTLLVLNRKGRPERERMLDYAVNYGAIVPPDDDLVFAVKGLIGSYEGYFSLLPYYVKIKEYSDMESRDIWEYRLNFSQVQVDRLVRHAWEVGSTYFDYFFFKENCSYHLLSLLEVANPELHLRERFALWAIPADTIRAVLKHEGVLKAVTYRPSRGTQMDHKLAMLADHERELLDHLIDDAGFAEHPAFHDLPPGRQALVLDTAVDYFQYRIAADPEEEPADRTMLRRLLVVRSRIETLPAAEAGENYQATPPQQGHGSARISAALGEANGEQPFVDLSWQAAYHDLMSQDQGYAESSQIHGVLFQFRHEDETDRTRLERFSALDLISLSPLTPLIKRPSFSVRVGWEHNRDGGCADCTPFIVDGALGLAARTALFSREVYFAMASASIEADDELDKGFRAGLGARVGLMVDFTPAWRAALLGSTLNFSQGDGGEVRRAELRQRFSLSTDLELKLDFLWLEDYREGRLGLAYYF
jgi:hypothetical protein